MDVTKGPIIKFAREADVAGTRFGVPPTSSCSGLGGGWALSSQAGVLIRVTGDVWWRLDALKSNATQENMWDHQLELKADGSSRQQFFTGWSGKAQRCDSLSYKCDIWWPARHTSGLTSVGAKWTHTGNDTGKADFVQVRGAEGYYSYRQGGTPSTTGPSFTGEGNYTVELVYVPSLRSNPSAQQETLPAGLFTLTGAPRSALVNASTSSPSTDRADSPEVRVTLSSNPPSWCATGGKIPQVGPFTARASWSVVLL